MTDSLFGAGKYFDIGILVIYFLGIYISILVHPFRNKNIIDDFDNNNTDDFDNNNTDDFNNNNYDFFNNNTDDNYYTDDDYYNNNIDGY
jgi:hypothetical protein